eukprot:TRINITY_DN4444_c0_g1_i12.p1 TRINITY_DN4444_c0_g1~~TRINITY_DN4444_c0_g1_i12.p1  ORF type:complete len:247 (-),score=37.02 TRINITY_DN4444_c0_g1_i12:159-794(-)
MQPATQTYAEMVSAVESAIELAISRTQGTDWELVFDVDGVKLESHLYPQICEGFNCFRSCGYVNATPSQCAEWFWKMKKEDFREIDDSLEFFQSRDVDENTKIEHQVNNLPWPLWPRQSSVILRKKSFDDGSIWIVQTSVENPEVPRDDTTYVRVKIYYSAWGFLDCEGKTKMWRVAHVDPQGNIPSWVVNQFTDKMAAYIHYFKRKSEVF